MYKDFMIKIAVLLALFAAVSCERQQAVMPEVPETPETKEPLGSYIYDGKEFPVYSTSCINDGSQIFFKISPIEEAGSQTTYALVGVNASLEGVEIDVAKAWHNDDYYFIYEDPVMYYSQYRQLASGTIFIKCNGEASEDYEVKVDVVLPDGKGFSFEQ